MIHRRDAENSYSFLEINENGFACLCNLVTSVIYINLHKLAAKEMIMSDFWAFRTMVTPVIIQVLFWVGVMVCIIAGLVMIVMGIKLPGEQMVLKGVLLAILGPLGVRVYCEILIVFFRINETLTEIKHSLDGRQAQAE